MGGFGGSGAFPGGGGGGPGPAGPAGPAGAEGPQGPAGADGLSALAPNWHWVEAAGVEGGDTDFSLASWTDAADATGGASPQNITDSLILNNKGILLSCPAGVSGYYRPVAIGDGDDVCLRIVPMVDSGASGDLTTTVVAEVQGFALETGLANGKWGGVGPRWNNVTLAAESTQGIARRGATGLTSSNTLAESGLAMTEAVKAWDIRIRRSGSGAVFFYAIAGGAWRRAGSIASASLNMGSGTVHVGVRVSNSALTQRAAILAYKHFAGGIPAAYL